MRLRNLGIYALPDGSEYVADAANAGSYVLVSARIWDVFRFADYRINAEGRLLCGGTLTEWSIRHLKYTGRDAEYPAPSLPL